MTKSPQSKQQGWFKGWREQRRAVNQARLEREHFAIEQADEPGGVGRRARAYQHSGSAPFFGGFGGDGGGCGGDGGGGGGC